MRAGSRAHAWLNATTWRYAASARQSQVSMWLKIRQPLSCGAFDASRTIQRTRPAPLRTFFDARHAPAFGMNSGKPAIPATVPGFRVMESGGLRAVDLHFLPEHDVAGEVATDSLDRARERLRVAERAVRVGVAAIHLHREVLALALPGARVRGRALGEHAGLHCRRREVHVALDEHDLLVGCFGDDGPVER